MNKVEYLKSIRNKQTTDRLAMSLCKHILYSCDEATMKVDN